MLSSSAHEQQGIVLRYQAGNVRKGLRKYGTSLTIIEKLTSCSSGSCIDLS